MQGIKYISGLIQKTKFHNRNFADKTLRKQNKINCVTVIEEVLTNKRKFNQKIQLHKITSNVTFNGVNDVWILT